ncbi:MAG TPA: mycothiol synthase [Catenuloplanes sp.]|jgi:mycothiol synthase
MSTAPALNPAVRQVARLTVAEVADVLALARAAGDADGSDPLGEHVILSIRHGGTAAVHLLAHRADGRLAGYAHLERAATDNGPTATDNGPTAGDGGHAAGGDGRTGEAAGAAAELVVHPAHRRHGLGRALAVAALAAAHPGGAAAGGTGLRVWAHGDHPGARALARTLGFHRARVLWQLRRPSAAALPEVPVPAGVTLRAFRPGVDDAAWVRLNSRAFATHPEQGRWTGADLRVRMSEPWFDPAGFLLAVDGTGSLLGFHWTKVHAEGAGGGRREPIGEVYVLGVDPAAHGRGLGAALTVAGLRHLRGRGLTEVLLYVDEANRTAVALYERLGFTRFSTDVGYQHTG